MQTQFMCIQVYSFSTFFDLGEKQFTYQINFIYIGKVKRGKHGIYDHSAHGRRTNTGFYTVPNCRRGVVHTFRKTFKDIFTVTHRKVWTLTVKKKRCNKQLHRKYTEFFNRIDMFPRKVNQHIRKRSAKEYVRIWTRIVYTVLLITSFQT